MKTCTKCGESKAATSEFFYTDKLRLASWCKCCTKLAAKIYGATNPEKQAERTRKKKFGLSPATFNAMLSQQLDSCAVCGVEFSTVTKSPCVDHDHRTGKVRALLCMNCNVAIGHLKDSAHLARAVAAYLESHRG